MARRGNTRENAKGDGKRREQVLEKMRRAF